MLMHTVDIDGSLTRYVTAGDPGKPALLMLHGQALSADVWLRNLDALGESHHVVAVDMLGHAFTQPAEGLAPTIPAKLDHLAALVEALELKDLSVCGSSYGALLAVLFSLRHRERVRKLIIAGSGSCFNSEEQLARQVRRLYEIYHPTLTSSTPEMWRQRIGATFFDKAKVPLELPMIAQLIYAQPWAEACWQLSIDELRDSEAMRPLRVLDRLEEISTPTLVLWGRDDRGGILESAEAGVARMPDARLQVFDGCGHYPMLEHPEDFNRIVADFLAA